MRPVLREFLIYPTPFTCLTKGLKPPKIASLQTDGSFTTFSRTAVIMINRAGEEHNLFTTYFDHKHSMESEWFSIVDGIQYAIRKDEGSFELENDCLPVVRSIINKKVPRSSLLANYYTAVFKEIRKLEYFGIRWIPRELNKADELFR